jgi:ATPase family associated with various cellular activities (AAA)
MDQKFEFADDIESLVQAPYVDTPKMGADVFAVNASALFSERKSGYLSEYQLFLHYHRAIPNIYSESPIQCDNAIIWFEENYGAQISGRHYTMKQSGRKRKFGFEEIFFLLDKDLIVYFDTVCSRVRFLFRETDPAFVEAIFHEVRKFKYREKRAKCMSLLVHTKHGIDTELVEITKPKLNIEDNYNDDFKPIHETIFRRLSKQNDKGIVLLHGKPGTGKTSYIRHLVASLRKHVIFLPPNMAAIITNPELVSVLLHNQNTIFVIEDAENIVVDRNTDGNSPVSAILNISDGLLSDCLNIQIICSFNTDISKVDSALMRKGRLIAKYEFKELETAKAQRLSEKLAKNTKICRPMTLSDIYNCDDMDFQSAACKPQIGFRTGAPAGRLLQRDMV